MSQPLKRIELGNGYVLTLQRDDMGATMAAYLYLPGTDFFGDRQKVKQTEMFDDGNINADYDAHGDLVGIEFL